MLTMRYLGLFLLLFVTSSVRAQIIEDKEPAILEVHYIKTWVADTLENRSYTDPMTLRIGKTSAMFYPTKMMWADSLCALRETPPGNESTRTVRVQAAWRYGT